MDNKTVYIHYGHKVFDINEFQPIKNCWNKPIGGLWASAVDTYFGWKDWCEYEDFRECNEEDSFKFVLKDGAKVLSVNTAEDIKAFPVTLADPKYYSYSNFGFANDFERIVNDGWDAVVFNTENLDFQSIKFGKFSGWDCDSILILNPDIIESI